MPDAPATTTPRTSRAPSPQQPSEDDICPLCHVLLINPVITSCNHTFCQSCISHWAAVAPVSTTLTPVPLDTPLPSADSNEASIPLEMLCPMCRTVSGITPDSARAATLRARYTTEYAQRLAEDGETTWGNDLGLGAGTGKIEYLTLHIGNLHDYARDVGLEDFSARKSENQHRWTFFVRPSRCDVVRSVLIVLHQTFSPSSVARMAPPYQVTRLGWGYFTIRAQIELVPGYRWLADEATGGGKRKLWVEWQLDFDNGGSMARIILRVLREGIGNGAGAEDAEGVDAGRAAIGVYEALARDEELD